MRSEDDEEWEWKQTRRQQFREFCKTMRISMDWVFQQPLTSSRRTHLHVRRRHTPELRRHGKRESKEDDCGELHDRWLYCKRVRKWRESISCGLLENCEVCVLKVRCNRQRYLSSLHFDDSTNTGSHRSKNNSINQSLWAGKLSTIFFAVQKPFCSKTSISDWRTPHVGQSWKLLAHNNKRLGCL